MKSEKINPCPCGHLSPVVMKTIAGKYYFVFCKACGIRGPNKLTELEAITAWNKQT
jgi:transcription elongation factor Elf1